MRLFLGVLYLSILGELIEFLNLEGRFESYRMLLYTLSMIYLGKSSFLVKGKIEVTGSMLGRY